MNQIENKIFNQISNQTRELERSIIKLIHAQICVFLRSNKASELVVFQVSDQVWGQVWSITSEVISKTWEYNELY